MLPSTITKPLSLYLDEEADRHALDEACAALRDSPVDMAELLDWLRVFDATAERKALAQRAVRAALGLPLIPGPPCRSG